MWRWLWKRGLTVKRGWLRKLGRLPGLSGMAWQYVGLWLLGSRWSAGNRWHLLVCLKWRGLQRLWCLRASHGGWYGCLWEAFRGSGALMSLSYNINSCSTISAEALICSEQGPTL
jgi:hypothetical protein